MHVTMFAVISEERKKGDVLRFKEENPLHSNFNFNVFDLIFLNTEYKKEIKLRHYSNFLPKSELIHFVLFYGYVFRRVIYEASFLFVLSFPHIRSHFCQIMIGSFTAGWYHRFHKIAN